jgi:hypothetical protein
MIRPMVGERGLGAGEGRERNQRADGRRHGDPAEATCGEVGAVTAILRIHVVSLLRISVQRDVCAAGAGVDSSSVA